MELQRGGTGFAAHDKELQVGGGRGRVGLASGVLQAGGRQCGVAVPCMRMHACMCACMHASTSATAAAALRCACTHPLRASRPPAGQEALPAGPRQRAGGPARADGGSHQQVWAQVGTLQGSWGIVAGLVSWALGPPGPRLWQGGRRARLAAATPHVLLPTLSRTASAPLQDQQLSLICLGVWHRFHQPSRHPVLYAIGLSLLASAAPAPAARCPAASLSCAIAIPALLTMDRTL